MRNLCRIHWRATYTDEKSPDKRDNPFVGAISEIQNSALAIYRMSLKSCRTEWIIIKRGSILLFTSSYRFLYPKSYKQKKNVINKRQRLKKLFLIVVSTSFINYLRTIYIKQQATSFFCELCLAENPFSLGTFPTSLVFSVNKPIEHFHPSEHRLLSAVYVYIYIYIYIYIYTSFIYIYKIPRAIRY